MAKLKKRSKLSQQRHKANQLNNPNGTKKNESNQANKVILLLNKLQKSSNASVNEKLITINNILVQCNNDESIRKLFLKNDLVKIILNDILKEDNQFDEILVSCFDLLKHLIVEEDYDLSIYLLRNGIWEILESNFKKAFSSLDHLNDSNVNIVSKDLLLNYINNLIGVLDNLVLELNSDSINNILLPKLINSTVVNGLFSVLKVEDNNNNKFKNSLILNILQVIYDLSSVSIGFLQNFLLNNEEFKLNFQSINEQQFSNNNTSSLTKIFIIGINLQIFEINDDLNDNNLNGILSKIFEILNNIDINSEKDDEFQIVDISLDLLTTIIEIKGSLLLEDESKRDLVFNSTCIDQILPFLGKLFEIDFKNNKKLVCLNNLMIYLNSNNLVSDKLMIDLENLNNNKITNEFNTLLQSSNDIEVIIDYLSFKLNLIEINPEKFSTQESLSQINKLIELGMKLSSIEEMSNIELQIQFITTLLMYLSIIAKNINNLEVTKAIVEFIVKYNLIEPISFYNNKLQSGLNISKFHKQYNYFIEESINISINSLFELFDDDYSYNKTIYHDGDLNNVLINILSDYRKIYKNIDKNVNLRLKRQTEETLNNLQRFIEYKKTEL